MELGKLALEAALKAISYTQLDVRKTYKLQRKLDRVGQLSLTRLHCRAVDMEIKREDHAIPVRLFFPGGETAPEEAILFFHGGGWVTGDVDTYNLVCAVTARCTGRLVASVDYRLAPEHKFPEGLMDCYEAARYLFWNAPDVLGMGPEQISLMGDSAGGNLAAAVSLMARDRGEFSPRQQILLYPAAYNDHTEQSPYPSVRENGTDYVLTSARIREFMELYQRTPKDLQSPYFAPLLAKDFSRQPRTLVVTAQFDPLRDEGEDYGRKLREAGNEVSIYRMNGALHGFFSLPAGTSLVKKSFVILNAFLRGEAQISGEEEEHEVKEEHTLETAR